MNESDIPLSLVVAVIVQDNREVHVIAAGSASLSIGVGIRAGCEEFERGVDETTLLTPGGEKGQIFGKSGSRKCILGTGVSRELWDSSYGPGYIHWGHIEAVLVIP